MCQTQLGELRAAVDAEVGARAAAGAAAEAPLKALNDRAAALEAAVEGVKATAGEVRGEVAEVREEVQQLFSSEAALRSEGDEELREELQAGDAAIREVQRCTHSHTHARFRLPYTKLPTSPCFRRCKSTKPCEATLVVWWRRLPPPRSAAA